MVQGFGFAQFGPVGAVQPTKFGGDGPESQALIAEWTTRFGPGDYTPPVLASVGFGFMILIGFTLGCVWLLLPLLFRDWVIRLRFPLWLILLGLPLPFIAVILGWISREVGRQPWAAYGLLPTEQAVSPVSAPADARLADRVQPAAAAPSPSPTGCCSPGTPGAARPTRRSAARRPPPSEPAHPEPALL